MEPDIENDLSLKNQKRKSLEEALISLDRAPDEGYYYLHATARNLHAAGENELNADVMVLRFKFDLQQILQMKPADWCDIFGHRLADTFKTFKNITKDGNFPIDKMKLDFAREVARVWMEFLLISLDYNPKQLLGMSLCLRILGMESKRGQEPF